MGIWGQFNNLLVFFFSDFTVKSPSAVDFFDIDDAADDIQVFFYGFLILYGGLEIWMLLYL